MAKSDVFVILDDVQLPRGASYVTRNLVKTAGGEQWLTVPIKDRSGLNLIGDVVIAQDGKWQKKHWRTMQRFYAKAPYFGRYATVFRETYEQPWERICELNIALIEAIKDMLGIKTQLVMSSDVDVQDTGAGKILGILKGLKASTYITGGGAGTQRYIREVDFKQHSINLVYQHFQHPVYSQLWGGFIPNLSIVDLLFNAGEESLQILMDCP
jgi:hypothetical protein